MTTHQQSGFRAESEQHAGIPRRAFVKSGVLGAAAAALPAGPALLAAQETPAVLTRQKARNIIFCVSDGMSAGVLALAEHFSLLTRGRGTNWLRLAARPGTVAGLMDTASANSLVTDSAAASSAWSGGARVNNGSLNITPDGRETTPIGVRFKQAGRKFGLVTTATVTHATPAGFAVCQSSRADEAEIAPKYPGLADVILGGGRAFFDPAERADKEDLLRAAREAGYAVCLSREELIRANNAARILGLFSKSHLPYVIDLPNSPGIAAAVPSLEEMTRAAIRSLSRHPEGFLLQIEGARVDHAAHQNDIAALLREQLAFDDALGAALEFAEESGGTLVIVTTDHGNSNPGLNGMGEAYTESTADFARVTAATASLQSLLAWAAERLKSAEGLPPSALAERIEQSLGIRPRAEEAAVLLAALREEPVASWNRQHANFCGLLGQITGNHTGVGWTGVTHTADPALLHAAGPGSGEFAGWFRNEAVAARLLAIAGV